MLFGVPWIFDTFDVSQVAYHRSLSGWPLNMKHGFLITDWHFWQSWWYSCVTLLSHSLQVFFFAYPPIAVLIGLLIFFFISLIQTSFSVLPCFSWLTAIRHWTCSLCFLSFSLQSPNQPTLLPVVHGSGSLPSAKGIYS